MLAHMMFANVAGEEFLISEDDALKIATAWCGVRRHYGGIGFDPKHAAIFGLVTAVGTVHVPRLRQRLARKRAEAEAARIADAAEKMASGSTVVPMPGSGRG